VGMMEQQEAGAKGGRWGGGYVRKVGCAPTRTATKRGWGGCI
jgi:hypothetical protein